MKKNIILCLFVISALIGCKKGSVPVNQNKPIPVELIKVNGKLTEISKTEGSTAPVILISGFGSDLRSWQPLYSALDPNTSVFTFNRAGVGASENIPGPRDAKTIAQNMKELLDACQIKPPYILAGHSMGGIYARMFYHLYPDKVKGIVLVDATHERQLDSLLSMIPQPDRDQAIAGMTAIQDSVLHTMPEGSLKEEFRANFATNYQQIREYPAIRNIPMYVVTSTQINPDNPPFVVQVHEALHEQWALSAGNLGRLVKTAASGHFIQVEEPRLVAEGVRWVLSK